MSYSVDIKNGLATFHFEVSAESFAHELEKEIFRSKDKMNLSVYRDGKVPQEVIQQMYNRDELLKRVINTIIGMEYEAAIQESGYITLTAPLAKVLNCKRGEPFTFTLDTILKPELEVCNYVGIEVPPLDFTVLEEDVEKAIHNVLKKCEKTIEITNRAAQEGDRVYIDFEGFLHGRAFEGNKANNFPLVLGSHSFIPGFEEEVIGVGLNEAKDFTVTYPSDYKIDTLAGQDVVFRCIVRRILQVEVPELNDEFVKANTKFEDVATYKANVRKSLELQKRMAEYKKKENAVLKHIVENTNVDVPEQLFDIEEKRIDSEQQATMKQRGVTLEKHLKMLGQTEDVYREQVKRLAVNRVKTRLILLDIARREKLDATEEEYEKEVEHLVKTLKKPEENFRHPFSKHQILNEIRIQKALRFVMENANVLMA